jgi:exosortase/archaeosortase family protein
LKIRVHQWFNLGLVCLPLAWLWFVLINNLRIEWTVNPQYSYGWAVPFLCVFLLWQRIQKTEDGKQKAKTPFCFLPSKFQFFALALCALLYAPTRLIEEANPGWRLVSWSLALEVVGITLCALHLGSGAPPLRYDRGEVSFSDSAFQLSPFRTLNCIFPICFFLVAVPWPSFVEQPLIQGLTRLDTSITTELLGWFGIPAMPHGNVIEVATGMVGIDEACSGIRSFQATLMISLFLGEYYSLGMMRRVVCVFAGFALSFLFNLARMSLLVWAAARKGVAAIASWHDPAGVFILVACFFSLWALGGLLKGGRPFTKAETLKTESLKAENGRRTAKGGGADRKNFSVSAFSTALTAWILLTEISVEGWYRWHEAQLPVAEQWLVAWPTNNPTFKESPLSEPTRRILRYDDGRSAGWSDGDKTWQIVFLHWKPGRTAIHLAQNHTPNICLTAAGYKLDLIASQEWLDVNGLRMPFSVNEVTDTSRPFYVFYCLWDDRASVQGFETMGLTYGNRLAPVLAGLRNPGQRSLEIAVSGAGNAAEAEAAVLAELDKLIVAKP